MDRVEARNSLWWPLKQADEGGKQRRRISTDFYANLWILLFNLKYIFDSAENLH